MTSNGTSYDLAQGLRGRPAPPPAPMPHTTEWLEIDVTEKDLQQYRDLTPPDLSRVAFLEGIRKGWWFEIALPLHGGMWRDLMVAFDRNSALQVLAPRFSTNEEFDALSDDEKLAYRELALSRADSNAKLDTFLRDTVIDWNFVDKHDPPVPIERGDWIALPEELVTQMYLTVLRRVLQGPKAAAADAATPPSPSASRRARSRKKSTGVSSSSSSSSSSDGTTSS